jgi:hypothetical protein
MMIAVEDIFPKKILKKGLSLPIYEGSVGRDHLTLTLRETRHLEPAFLSRILVTFLNMVASLDEPSQLLLQRLMADVAAGRTCKQVELFGRTLLYFPDVRGDPKSDLLLNVRSGKPDAVRKVKPKSKAGNAKPKATSTALAKK